MIVKVINNQGQLLTLVQSDLYFITNKNSQLLIINDSTNPNFDLRVHE